MVKASTDEARITRVLTANAPDLLRYFQRRLNYDDAADAVGEVMAIAWRRIGRIPQSPDEARMWLFVTARNVAANGLRAYERERTLTATLAATTHAAPRVGPAADVGSEVRDAIQRLDSRYAELVRLIHWDGFSIIETATILQINPSTARARYQRAKALLRITLGGDTEPDEAQRHEAVRAEIG